MSVTYETYTSVYHGSIVEEGEWPHAELLASARLARLKAMARVTPLVDDAAYADSMSICAMAEVMPQGLGSALTASVRPWLHVGLVHGAFR